MLMKCMVLKNVVPTIGGMEVDIDTVLKFNGCHCSPKPSCTTSRLYFSIN